MLKQQCRSAALRLLKSDELFLQHPRSFGLSRPAQSALVCKRLIALLEHQYRPRSVSPQDPFLEPEELVAWDQARSHRSTASPSTVSVLCYFAMPFELDLRGVMQYLWSRNGEGTKFRVYVPHMLPKLSQDSGKATASRGGKMVFVQVHGEEDCERSFVPQGKLRILEIRTEVLTSSLWDSSDSRDILADTEETIDTLAALHNPSQATLRRPFLSLSERTQSGEQFVVLTPAAAYDSRKQRMGKGGGYYDRFLSGLLCVAAKETTVLGVGFDQQLLLPSETTTTDGSTDGGVFIPVEEGWDQPVDAVITGHSFVV